MEGAGFKGRGGQKESPVEGLPKNRKESPLSFPSCPWRYF